MIVAGRVCIHHARFRSRSLALDEAIRRARCDEVVRARDEGCRSRESEMSFPEMFDPRRAKTRVVTAGTGGQITSPYADKLANFSQ